MVEKFGRENFNPVDFRRPKRALPLSAFVRSGHWRLRPPGYPDQLPKPTLRRIRLGPRMPLHRNVVTAHRDWQGTDVQSGHFGAMLREPPGHGRDRAKAVQQVWNCEKMGRGHKDKALSSATADDSVGIAAQLSTKRHNDVRQLQVRL